VVFNEPGSDVVLPLLDGSLLSAVNLAEVHTMLLLRGAGSDFAWRRLLGLGCEIRSFGEEEGRLAAELAVRQRGLSLADRACLALAMRTKAVVYTANSTWKSLGLGVRVEAIR